MEATQMSLSFLETLSLVDEFLRSLNENDFKLFYKTVSHEKDICFITKFWKVDKSEKQGSTKVWF